MRDMNILACWLFALCKGAQPQRSSGCAVIRYDFRAYLLRGCRTDTACCCLYLLEVRS